MSTPTSTLLPRETYLGPPNEVARLLLGKLLIRKGDGDERLAGQMMNGRMTGRIVETEAYLGLDDPAAHAFAGRTARTEVLFGPPGHAYVYLIYGMYACLNVSCEPEGHAGCVLIRALEPLEGMAAMAINRKLTAGAKPAALTAGPGRLCQAFGITRARHNGMDLTTATSDLQIHQDDFSACEIAVTPRIGITRAAERPLRFTLSGHPCVSKGRYYRPGAVDPLS